MAQKLSAYSAYSASLDGFFWICDSGGISRTTVSIRHICHIRQRFAETFGVGVFFGGFPKTPKRFGVFDVPKSIGLVW
jgi:hypothetical protein